MTRRSLRHQAGRGESGQGTPEFSLLTGLVATIVLVLAALFREEIAVGIRTAGAALVRTIGTIG